MSLVDEQRYPNAIILMGNVKVAHEGATLNCKRALLFKEKNLLKALGEVVIEQGDSIIQYSDFASYDGNTKIAKSWGNVEANDKVMKLSTDTLYFDRQQQLAYYPSGGTIRDKTNTLKSTVGTYYFQDKKFVAKNNVKITNPDNIIDSEKLDYYTQTNKAYINGATTILNRKDSTKIYTKQGFYDSNRGVSYAIKDNILYLNSGRTISADSLYYDKARGYASATNNIRVNDTLNKLFTRGNYAEVFEKKDSLFITKRAVSISIIDKDSMYIHGDRIVLTGKKDNRIVRAYHNVKIFKSDLQGKCDSIFSSERTGFTKMFKKPVLWSDNQQISGDTIHFLSNTKTKKLDSLFVYNKAFMIQQDTISKTQFNQIKGRDLLGKFKDNYLKDLLVNGNAESVFYHRDEKTNKLKTITKMIASDIEFIFENRHLEFIKYIKQTEGKTYPPSKYPKDLEKLKGFLWRESERPKSKEDIFIKSDEEKSLKKTKPNFDYHIKKTVKQFKKLEELHE